jgi:hypothetical protein
MVRTLASSPITWIIRSWCATPRALVAGWHLEVGVNVDDGTELSLQVKQD